MIYCSLFIFRLNIMKYLVLTIILCLFLLPAVAAGDIYRYVDENGVTVFTDNPVHSGFKVHLREKGSFRLASVGGYYPYRNVVL